MKLIQRTIKMMRTVDFASLCDDNGDDNGIEPPSAARIRHSLTNFLYFLETDSSTTHSALLRHWLDIMRKPHVIDGLMS